MKKKMRVCSMLTLIVMMFVMVGVTTPYANAAAKGWNLRYAKGSPTSEQITSKTVEGTMSSTKKISVTVSSFSCSGNGWVYLSTTKGGMSVFFNASGSAKSTSTVTKNTTVKGTATITNPSILNNCFSSGSFSF